MSSEFPPPRRSVLLSFRFLGVAIAGSTLMALVSTFGPLPAQLGILGAFVSILGGLFFSYLGQEEQRERDRAEAIQSLSVPLALSADRELYQQYQKICRSMTALAKRSDAILRRVALLKFASVADQLDSLAEGRIVFAVTEGWRTVYEQLLNDPDIRQYRSVAWVRTPAYWQDGPGRRSMEANFEAVHRGVLVERIIILSDGLWPVDQVFPSPEIRDWIAEQHDHGLWIALVREATLNRESDLLVDLGIYGSRAVGVQELDEHCRTLRFTLDMDPQSVQLADERWKRLLLYSQTYRNLLDASPPEA